MLPRILIRSKRMLDGTVEVEGVEVSAQEPLNLGAIIGGTIVRNTGKEIVIVMHSHRGTASQIDFTTGNLAGQRTNNSTDQ